MIQLRRMAMMTHSTRLHQNQQPHQRLHSNPDPPLASAHGAVDKPLLRLNVETRDDPALLERQVGELTALIAGE